MKAKCDCCQEAIDNCACGCCEGIAMVTPVPVYNRPGLSELVYRIGTHSGFFATMKARLSGFYFESKDSDGKLKKSYPLEKLTTRDTNDPAIALLDSWATVADVLTFYQERIANEGYLRTATERRSIVELARLAGYKPRPGVAASVFLAYNIEPTTTEEVVIPAGSRAQSMPGPDEMPQSFESSDDLKAKAQWNNLRPRITQAQTSETIKNGSRIYLKGINTNLRKNDALLIDSGVGKPVFKRVVEVLPDNENDRTLVNFIKPPPLPFNDNVFTFNIIHQLVLPASIQPANQFQLRQSLAGQFVFRNNAVLQNTGSDFGVSALSAVANQSIRPTAQAAYSVLGAFSPVLSQHLGTATANTQLIGTTIKVYAFRATASLFGHNAPKEPRYEPALIRDDGELRANPKAGNLKPQPWPEWKVDIGKRDTDSIDESGNILYLDRVYKEVFPGDYIAIQMQNAADPEVYSVDTVQNISRNAYGISSETTRIQLNKNSWWDPAKEKDIQEIRTTKVYVQPEELELAEEPITDPVCGGTDDPIELDGFYEGLEAGRWVIVSGEREIEGTNGIRFSEPAILASVTQDIAEDKKKLASTGSTPVYLPGEKRHSFIKLAEKLAYCFKRESVSIHGNVVKATHGETRLEVLGSGDGAKALQAFTLKQKPLTHVSAANPSGIDSTLKLFVNNVEWHEVDSLAGLQVDDRRFITQTDNEDKISVIFGNGAQGARLPSGVENIRAEYRNGIGRAGNVKAEQISLLLTKPLGVKDVINPLRASGGADKETRDQARRHIPLAIKALDRLVSTQDYEDFSRIYAGIGKAYAVELSNGRLPLIHVTIAGVGDIPIDTNSDLFRNLRQALYDFGDPFQKIQLAARELLMIVLEAGVAILPDYQWESVVSEVRSAMLDHFSFERRELGQDVILSEVISVMQSVRGVAYIDVNAFGGVPEKQPLTKDEINILTNWGKLPLVDRRRFLTPDEIAEEVAKIVKRIQNLTEDQIKALRKSREIRVPQRLAVNLPVQEKFIRPAQLAFLSPDVPATLILNQIK